ncbi:MAG TPA: hypothetical protein VJW76_14305 [Verrucomicrobiae bacterium]|nr:hypothetical protein [Verrucomicrobiae bacterium]
MEIKVKCVCGSSYSFEEIPVNGRLAFPVSCTNCGADGTASANNFIARTLAGEFEAPQKPKGGFSLLGFRRNKAEFEETGSVAASHAADESGDETSRARITLAMLGAIAVGGVGAWGWLQLAKATGFEFGFAAWAIGGLVGYASRLFAPRGHYWLGPTAALAAFLSIGGGQVLVRKWLVDEEVHKALPLAYEETREYAKAAVEAESGDELRECLARYRIPLRRDGGQNTAAASGGNGPLFQLGWRLYGVFDQAPGSTPTFKQLIEASNPRNITDEDLALFQSRELPNLKAFLNGKPSEEEYKSTLKAMIYAKISFNDLVTQSIGPYSLLWLALGLYTAYKLARNAGLSY